MKLTDSFPIMYSNRTMSHWCKMSQIWWRAVILIPSNRALDPFPSCGLVVSKGPFSWLDSQLSSVISSHLCVSCLCVQLHGVVSRDLSWGEQGQSIRCPLIAWRQNQQTHILLAYLKTYVLTSAVWYGVYDNRRGSYKDRLLCGWEQWLQGLPSLLACWPAVCWLSSHRHGAILKLCFWYQQDMILNSGQCCRQKLECACKLPWPMSRRRGGRTAFLHSGCGYYCVCGLSCQLPEGSVTRDSGALLSFVRGSVSSAVWKQWHFLGRIAMRT